MQIKIADLVSDWNWNWPSSWNGRFAENIDVQVSKLTVNGEVKSVWINKKGNEKGLSMNEAWKVMKASYPKVIWYEHVWFSQCVPRHSFIL